MQKMQETGYRSLGQEDPLEKEMATHSSVLAWKILWTEEPGGLESIGWQRVGHNWAYMPAGRSQERRRGTQHKWQGMPWDPHSGCASPLIQTCLWPGAMLKERQNLTVPEKMAQPRIPASKESHPACIPPFPHFNRKQWGAQTSIAVSPAPTRMAEGLAV